jgi:aflatoxin B1 aldehyde reductase
MPPHLVFGAGGIGTTTKSFTYTFDTPGKASEVLDLLQKLNIMELDGAASYPPGNPWDSERLLGLCRATERGFKIDSKVAAHVIDKPALDDESISSSLDRSLQLLGSDRVQTFYAHRPDALTPLEETAAAFHKQYLAGKFERVSEISSVMPFVKV